MLKIKDNVDLRALKKFGFYHTRSIDDGQFYWCICNLFIGKDRIIKQDDDCNPCVSMDYEMSEWEINILFDLIKADLVEKVEDE